MDMEGDGEEEDLEDEDDLGDEELDIGDEESGYNQAVEDDEGGSKKMTSRQIAMQGGGNVELLSLPTEGNHQSRYKQYGVGSGNCVGRQMEMGVEGKARDYIVLISHPIIGKKRKPNPTSEEAQVRRTQQAEKRRKKQEVDAALNKVNLFLTSAPSYLLSFLPFLLIPFVISHN